MYFPCTQCSWVLCNTKRGSVKAFRSLRTSFGLAWGLKFMAKLPGGQAFGEIEPIVMECVPVLHNFFMTFVRNTIYISSFDLSATIYNGRKKRPQYTLATRLNQRNERGEFEYLRCDEGESWPLSCFKLLLLFLNENLSSNLRCLLW